MWFDTKEAYENAIDKINHAFGYPCENVTTYAQKGIDDVDGKYYLPIIPELEHRLMEILNETI